MFDCKNLLHPFQNDPGTSQRQRVIDALLDDTAQIDGRNLADLLNYFAELSAGINYYDNHMNVSDWRPFFDRSLPFLLSSISRHNTDGLREKFELYARLFNRTPSASGLQLLLHFIHYNIFGKVHHWHGSLAASELPAERFIDELIRTKLAAPLKTFIALANTAAKCFGVKRIDFMKFVDTDDNDAWDLPLAAIYRVIGDCNDKPTTRCEKLKELFETIAELFPVLLETLKTIPLQAEGSIQLSMVPQAKELQKNHPPHLALIFTFIRLFQKMQGELNKKKRDHLRFFYIDVLKLKPVEAREDKTFVVFELQKLLEDQYEKFRLKKGLLLNAGRDDKNADIIFETDNEIVVNETQVADLKTIYLHNTSVYEETFVEGVHMAPSAVMADGVDKAFSADPRNWYTIGNKNSKYTAPGKKQPKPYPHARLGFVLASPVLYLAEGERTITITLACHLETNKMQDYPCPGDDYPRLLDPANLYADVKSMIVTGYYIITEDLLQVALDEGVPQETIDDLRDLFPNLQQKLCKPNAPRGLKATSVMITDNQWTNFLNGIIDVDVKEALKHVFKERHILNVRLSGKEEWIDPSTLVISMQPASLAANEFVLQFVITLKADKPPVTFFQKEILKEDLDTTLPLVKIELDDEIKMQRAFDKATGRCCLLTDFDGSKQNVSLYHFFRHVRIISNIGAENTRIDVQVCGLKTFIVQNDENLMDVNAPIYPFGTRPDVTDFDLVNPPKNPPADVIGPNFYIGSKEIFGKKWTSLNVNLNWKSKPLSFKEYYKGYILSGLDEDKFQYRLSFLAGGTWYDEANNRKLFDATPVATRVCPQDKFYEYIIVIDNTTIPLANRVFTLNDNPFQKFEVSARDGFIKLNLRKQDFGHKNYAFVLARQMMAYSKLPKETIASAVYYNAVGDPIVIDFDTIFQQIKTAHDNSITAENNTNVLHGIIPDDILGPAWSWNPGTGQQFQTRGIVRGPNPPHFPDLGFPGLVNLLSTVQTTLNNVRGKIDTDELKKFAAIIPNEPWTPVIANMSLDYTATALMGDIDFIHLHPFANTSKAEQITLNPMLFPTFCDEGTLYIGLKDFQPGSNLSLLFQLAEATADSETETETVKWHYLDNNIWKELRKGFEVLNDGTQNLTASGIVQLALPENMTLINSVMPKNLYWIKASVAKNSRSVCETIGVHAQAVAVTFKLSEGSDKMRLANPLEPGKIEKLLVAEPAIKAVVQPYESFGGAIPELESAFPLRVSEHLRHKGRAIQKWDYERLVLQEFPMIHRAKCINHSFKTEAWKYDNDVPYAPGYVILAVIPDLAKLKAGNSYEPRVPVSLLEKIDAFIARRTSPFVRFRAANPRYEKVDFCITVRLVLGADKIFYEEKLKQDLSQYMAPWTIGQYEKFTFGQCVYRSDILQFLEQNDYVDFILDLKMSHEKESAFTEQPKVCPLSPRSILIAGVINVTIDDPACDSWCAGMPEKACKSAEPVVDYCNDKHQG